MASKAATQMSDHILDYAKKLAVAATLASCAYLYHFIEITNFKLAVLEWRVNQQIGEPEWKK